MEIIQILLSISLITVVIVQAKGTGLGSSWGGSGELYRSKRGVEKLLFYITIFLAVLFTTSSVINAL